MTIFFGVVKKYFPERGFGFITHPLTLGPNKEIFFHICNVENSNKDIAEKLSVYDRNHNICFWYEPETTRKGEQLKKILKSEDVSKLDKDNSDEFVQSIELIYENIDEPIPFWLNEVTIGLMATEGEEKLGLKRAHLIQKRNEEKELQRIEVERLKKIEEEKLEKERERIAEEKLEKERLKKIEEEKLKKERERIAEERKRFEEERQRQRTAQERERMIEEENREKEFEQLVAEMKSKGFTMSGQVSNYIIRNRLGDKYKHISGVLEMENEGSSWKFNGGFPPNIYARLCERLNLGNKGTNSRVVGFTSFKDLKR